MNEKRDLEALLGDVLIDPSNAEFFRTSARLNFRRQVRRRKVLRGMGTALTLLSLACLGLLPLKRDHSQNASVVQQAAVARSGKIDKTSPGLSDEELLRSFPPGSCFLAEVNGKTVLVFTDESVKKELLN
jgi:hypothetical protein